MLVYKSVRVCACVYVSVLVLLDKGCAAPENVMLGPTPSGDGLIARREILDEEPRLIH